MLSPIYRVILSKAMKNRNKKGKGDESMYYALLSGGSGKRLWPLSNSVRPKQYLKLVNRETNSMERCSMLQRVWDQLTEAGMAENTIITAGKSRQN